jgi:CO/xanthine dehydrogenase Mo-binding subunit
MTVREIERERTWREVGTQGGVLGSRAAHHEFVDKVKGDLSYAADWHMPGMLYGKVVRSQRASARITSIDTSAVVALRGVVSVVTADDIPRNSVHEEATGLGLSTIDTPVLAADRVRYEGEPVALVAATTPEGAEAAAERIWVEYEDLPGVFDAEAAVEDNAPRVHEHGNVLIDWNVSRGDVDEVLKSAEVVVEGVYRTHAVDHAYLEPEAGIGWIDADGVVTLRVATQVIEHAREVASILQVPHSKVRVMGTYMGGGFGGKEDMTVEPHLALLVWKSRRPVKMVWSRQESILARPKRHPFVMRYRTGADCDGRIVAQDIEVIGDAGAYPYLSPRVMFAAVVTAPGPYRAPAARIENKAVFTNNVPNSAFRGFGAMQVTLGYECQIEKIAGALGLPSNEVRARNYLQKGDLLPTGETIETGVALPGATHRVIEALGPESAPSAPYKRKGRGIACNIQPYGRARFFRDKASCWMGFDPDGALIVRAGVTDLGGGQAASLCQIAAEVLGVPLDKVTAYIADSALTPLTGGTYATRQLYMSGNAAQKTAVELRAKLEPVATALLEVLPGDVEFVDGVVRSQSTPSKELTMRELLAGCEERSISPSHIGTFYAETGEFDPQKGNGKTFPDYTFGSHGVEVEVDVETGEIDIVKYVACHDVGRAINHLRVEGQIEGGVAQGIGFAVSEELARQEGTSLSTLFSDYLIPTALDIPEMDTIVLEEFEGKGPFGARGIGEPPIGPCAPAIVNAVADAVGARIEELPLTPDRVLTAIRQADARPRGPAEEKQ